MNRARSPTAPSSDTAKSGLALIRSRKMFRRHHGGEARRAIDQRHLAEHSARADFFHELALDGNREAAFQHDVHQHPGLAFLHDHLAALVGHPRLRERPRENGERGFVEHRRFLQLALRSGAARVQPADRLPKTADHKAHQHERELGFFPQGALELPVVEPDDAARQARDGARAAGRLADRGELAEDLALPDGADHLAACAQADFALQ